MCRFFVYTKKTDERRTSLNYGADKVSSEFFATSFKFTSVTIEGRKLLNGGVHWIIHGLRDEEDQLKRKVEKKKRYTIS